MIELIKGRIFQW